MTHRKSFGIGPLEIVVEYPLPSDSKIDVSWIPRDPDDTWTLYEIEQLKEMCEYALSNAEDTRRQAEEGK